MLWYKAWLETRWRFLIGLALLLLSAAGVVCGYPLIVKLMPAVPKLEGELGRMVAQSLEIMREYRGYAWSQWFGKNVLQFWTIFAVLLGTGGLLSEAPGGAALFTLSLPVSRSRLLSVRAAAGLGELAVLALVPSLLLPLLSPVIGQRFGLGDTLLHCMFLFAAGSVFFSLAFLLSSVFADLWRPLLIALGIAMLIAIAAAISSTFAQFSIYRVMSAQSYFLQGAPPWKGLLASMAVSAAMLYGASRITARQDF